MEFSPPVNEMLIDEITTIDYTLVPSGFKGDVRRMRIVQESLGKLIDELGEQSATAQGLSKAITSAEKLHNATDHVLYLLKDAASKNGKGEIIGFLKVASKYLYLFDQNEKIVQVEPLCVLDFFVKDDWQRRGNGKKLFDFMLEKTGTQARDLAIDGPSSKMETFLRRNYGIEHLVKQSNNFAVSPEFFNSVPDASKSARSTGAAASGAVGRYTARKPPSSIGNIIHGGHDCLVAQSDIIPKQSTPEEQDPLPKQPSPEPSPEPEPEPEPEPAPETPAAASPSPERPTTLPVAPAVSAASSPAGSAAPRRDSQLTDQGYFDMKFYHNKLW